MIKNNYNRNEFKHIGHGMNETPIKILLSNQQQTDTEYSYFDEHIQGSSLVDTIRKSNYEP